MATEKADPKKLEALRKQLETMRKSAQQQADAARKLPTATSALVLPALADDIDAEPPDLTADLG